MSIDERVILVDENDAVIGTMEKMEAHLTGELHRAFSVFIFNSNGELLMQQRAYHKYHSGGKWTNSCCSHPRPNEDTHGAANRRLQEEMGLKCELTHGFSFVYNSMVEDDLIEYEYDHVFFGLTDQQPLINTDEVADYRYQTLDDLTDDILANPDSYTEWLKICLNKVKEIFPNQIGVLIG